MVKHKGERSRVESLRTRVQKLQTQKGVRAVLNNESFLLQFVSPWTSLAIVPKRKRSLAEATLQIREAGETPMLGICMIITGRRKHLSCLASHNEQSLLQRHWKGRDKWGGEIFLILIKSVAFSSK
jgi:hypothetical protein